MEHGASVHLHVSSADAVLNADSVPEKRKRVGQMGLSAIASFLVRVARYHGDL